MMWFLLAVLCSSIAVIPLLIQRRFTFAASAWVAETLCLWFIFWKSTPGMVGPLGGAYGVTTSMLLLANALGSLIGTFGDQWTQPRIRLSAQIRFISLALGAVPFGLVLVLALFTSPTFMGKQYAQIIGTVEQRSWATDMQLKSPEHLRLVTREAAEYLSDKVLGQAPGSIGSQFAIAKENMNSQLVKGEIVYVTHLDFNGFSEWQNARTSPGYVVVSAEDPHRPVGTHFNEKFAYTPKASFQYKLVRHMRENGYLSVGLDEITLEPDENGKTWWVVATYQPTIGWSGHKITGAIIVDPVTGEMTQYTMATIPVWADRIIPKAYVQEIATDWGKLSKGWMNTWWGKENLLEAGEPNLNEGADNQPYWVMDMTSPSETDQSLVGYLFVHSRTGQAIFYRTNGGATDAAAMEAVNAQVKFKHFHSGLPAIYNVYGRLTAVCQVLGDQKNHQGVALVDINDMNTVAIGTTAAEAFGRYQTLLAGGSARVAPEMMHNMATVTGTVDRREAVVTNGSTTYYISLRNTPHLFSGQPELSPELPVTREGDIVTVGYIASTEDVQPLSSFDNKSVTLISTAQQDSVRGRQQRDRASDQLHRSGTELRDQLGRMSDAELQALMEKK